MGQALDRLYVLFAKTFVARHKRVTAEGTVEDVEAHWRELPASVRKTFKESMHAPTVQGGQSHPFDQPDTRPLKSLSPGERAVYEAVQQNVGQRKAEALRAKVGKDTRSAGYLKRGDEPKDPFLSTRITRELQIRRKGPTGKRRVLTQQDLDEVADQFGVSPERVREIAEYVAMPLDPLLR